MLTKEQFLDQYIVTGMATWATNNYSEYCSSGKHQGLRDHGIIEDLIGLGGDAYKVYMEEYNQRQLQREINEES